jgi:hypothetical protein
MSRGSRRRDGRGGARGCRSPGSTSINGQNVPQPAGRSSSSLRAHTTALPRFHTDRTDRCCDVLTCTWRYQAVSSGIKREAMPIRPGLTQVPGRWTTPYPGLRDRATCTWRGGSYIGSFCGVGGRWLTAPCGSVWRPMADGSVYQPDT